VDKQINRHAGSRTGSRSLAILILKGRAYKNRNFTKIVMPQLYMFS